MLSLGVLRCVARRPAPFTEMKVQLWREDHPPNGGSSDVSTGDLPLLEPHFVRERRRPWVAPATRKWVPSKGIDHVQWADILQVADTSPIWGTRWVRHGREKLSPMRSVNGPPLRQDPTPGGGELQFLATKVVPPRGLGLIERPRLFDMISQLPAKRLIVIKAPAGFGKTSLAWISTELN